MITPALQKFRHTWFYFTLHFAKLQEKTGGVRDFPQQNVPFLRKGALIGGE